jgi:hypothetical protein
MYTHAWGMIQSVTTFHIITPVLLKLPNKLMIMIVFVFAPELILLRS